MRRQRTSVAFLVVSSVLAALLCACGGGGGGGGGGTTPTDPLALLSGTYTIVGFSGQEGVPNRGRTSWGTIVSDGAGSITGAGMRWENSNGAVTGPSPSDPASYTINAARQLSVNTGGAPFVFGGISADGSVFAVGTIAGDPEIVIGGRLAGTWATADLLGDYHLCGWAYDQGTGNDISYFGSMTFDGLGAGTRLATRNSSGTIGIPIGPVGLTYSVAADGTVTAVVNTMPFTGYIWAGGSVVALAGATAGGVPWIYLLVKAGAGATNALLSGSYQGVGMTAPVPPASDMWIGSIVQFEADGAGMLTLGPFTSNADGEINTIPGLGATAPYAVAPDGGLGVDGQFLGGVSMDGRFAIFAGSDTPLDDPEIYFILR